MKGQPTGVHRDTLLSCFQNFSIFTLSSFIFSLGFLGFAWISYFKRRAVPKVKKCPFTTWRCMKRSFFFDFLKIHFKELYHLSFQKNKLEYENCILCPNFILVIFKYSDSFILETHWTDLDGDGNVSNTKESLYLLDSFYQLYFENSPSLSQFLGKFY